MSPRERWVESTRLWNTFFLLGGQLGPVNLERLRAAMDALRAEVIAVPPFEARYLERLRHGRGGQG